MSTTTAAETRRPWKKIVATGAIIAGGGALIAGGAFAIFTDSASTTLGVDAGQLDIAATGSYPSRTSRRATPCSVRS
jgi:predicted ribosomally synthesized peptide with SipW-like signal peptide